jgi:hypothetical protein
MSKDTASIVYLLVLLWPLICLTWLHAKGRIDLLTSITTTKEDKTFVDGKKLAYVGTFAVMATGFAYLAQTEKLTEWYAGLMVGAFVAGKWLGDREQRLNKAAEAAKPPSPATP